MRSQLKPLALACLALAGCSNQHPVAPQGNPFEEPGGSPTLAVQERMNLAAPLEQPVATAFVAPVARPIVASSKELELPSHLKELIAEAERLGQLGDMAGKADLLSQAGYTGHAKSFYDLAKMYLDGSLPSDFQQVHYYIALAHERGYTEATRVLGMLYLRGEGVPADEEFGRLLLENAASKSARASKEYAMLLLNLAKPELNNPELGLKYMQDAALQGDSDAGAMLAREAAKYNVQVSLHSPSDAALPVGDDQAVPDSHHQNLSPAESLKTRAMRGNVVAMVEYAQKVAIGKIEVQEREFTSYCWFDAASRLGSTVAEKELAFIRGVKTIYEQKTPGRLENCVEELLSQAQAR